MNNKNEILSITKPILYDDKAISLKVNNDKSLSFTDEFKKLDREQLNNFFTTLVGINNNTKKIPLNWSDTWIRVLLNIFAGLTTFTLFNYFIYLMSGIRLNHLGFVFDLTWLIFILIPMTVVISHVFSSKTMSKARTNYLSSTLPSDVSLVYFVTAFYNSLNQMKYFSQKEQAIRNANVVTKDIFDIDGLQMLEKDMRAWLKLSGIGVRDK